MSRPSKFVQGTRPTAGREKGVGDASMWPRAKAQPVSAFLDTSRAESFAIQQTRPVFERVNSIFGMGCHLDRSLEQWITMVTLLHPRLSLIFSLLSLPRFRWSNEWLSETNCSSFKLRNGELLSSSSVLVIIRNPRRGILLVNFFPRISRIGDRDLLLRIRGGYRWKRVLLSF